MRIAGGNLQLPPGRDPLDLELCASGKGSPKKVVSLSLEVFKNH